MGKVTFSFVLERTWVGSDESMAKSIADQYLGEQGIKVHKVEVSLSQRDAKIISILEAINRVLRRNIPDDTGTIPIIDQMIAQLREMMTSIDY